VATSHAGPSDNQTLENLQAAVLKLESGNLRAPQHRDHLFHAIVITHSTAS